MYTGCIFNMTPRLQTLYKNNVTIGFNSTFLPNTETPQHVCRETPLRNSPRIEAFVGDEAIQYFVLVEQCVLCQVPSFQYALFITFSAYYIFHLEYPKAVKNAMFFFQDYVLAYPDSQRRPATYLATASDIKKPSNLQ